MGQDVADEYFAEYGVPKGMISSRFYDASRATGPTLIQTLNQPFTFGAGDAADEYQDALLASGKGERDQLVKDHHLNTRDDSEGTDGSNGRIKRGGISLEQAKARDAKQERQRSEAMLVAAIGTQAVLEQLQAIYEEIARLDQEIAELGEQRQAAHDVSQEAFDLGHEAEDIQTKMANGTATAEDIARARELLGDKADGKKDEQLRTLLDHYIADQMTIGRAAATREETLERAIEQKRDRRNQRLQEADVLEQRIRATSAEQGQSPEAINELIQVRKDAAEDAAKADIVSTEMVIIRTGDVELDSAVADREGAERVRSNNKNEFDDTAELSVLPPLTTGPT